MMKIGHPSKLRVLVIALIFGSVMVLAQYKPAHAYSNAGFGGIVLLAVAAVVTYATVKGVACTPIAAAKGDDYPGGFSAAFGDCFSNVRSMKQTATAGENNDASDKRTEAEEANRNEDDHQEE